MNVMVANVMESLTIEEQSEQTQNAIEPISQKNNTSVGDSIFSFHHILNNDRQGASELPMGENPLKQQPMS